MTSWLTTPGWPGGLTFLTRTDAPSHACEDSTSNPGFTQQLTLTFECASVCLYMGEDAREQIEAAIRNACDGRDYERAATLTIKHYGPEILGFLAAQLREPDAAGEVFSAFSETFWRFLPTFEWRCSARTWAYKLARHAAVNHHRREQKRAQDVPLTQASQLSQAAAAVRSATAAYRKTETKDRFQELRLQLSEEDQLVLILRVDRGLSWREIAEVLVAGPEPAPEVLAREAARLRKRFQSIKQRLYELGRAAGLLE